VRRVPAGHAGLGASGDPDVWFSLAPIDGGEEALMAQCDVCGNEYDKVIAIEAWGRRHTFDCFECAIHLLAPVCDQCGSRIIGHGVETEAGRMFCCAHCARKSGAAIELRA
jgi:hypothetical protein